MANLGLKDPSYYMEIALAQAELAWSLGEIPVGAVVADGNGRILGAGCNRTISLNDPTAHAEIMAMRQAGLSILNYRLSGLNLYVTLEPCCMCAGAIIHGRIDTLYFGTRDPRTGACGSVFDVLLDSRHNHRVKIVEGVLQERCSLMLKLFFKERREMHKKLKQEKRGFAEGHSDKEL